MDILICLKTEMHFQSLNKPACHNLIEKTVESSFNVRFSYNLRSSFSTLLGGKIIFQYIICMSLNLLNLVKDYILVNLHVNNKIHF